MANSCANTIEKEGERYFSKVEFLENGKVKIYDSLGRDFDYTYTQYQNKINQLKEREKRLKKQFQLNKNKPSERLSKILYRGFNREFEKIAKGLNENNNPEFNQISITKEAYEKAKLIAKRQLKINGEYEIDMHLINKKSKKQQKDFTARDVFIPYGQRGTKINCGIRSPQGITRTNDELKLSNEYISGWAHSHANMGVFHSSDDKNRLKHRLSRNNHHSSPQPTTIKLKVSPFGIENEYEFRFFPSLVFNAKGFPPSKAIAIEFPQFNLESGITKEFYLNESPKLNIIKESNKITLDEKIIDNQIKERFFISEEELNKKDYEVLIPPEPRKPTKISKRVEDILNKNKSNFEKRNSESKIIDEQDSIKNKEKLFHMPRYLKKAIDFLKKKISYDNINDRLIQLEGDYSGLYEKYETLEKENISLEKRVKSLESIIGGN